MRTYQLFIDGAWRDGASTADVVSPWSGDVVGKVGVADAALLDEALAAGARAEKPMAALAAHERRDLLRDISERLRARQDEMADIICAESGKPMVAAKGEAARAVHTFRFAAEEAYRLADESVALDATDKGAGRFGVVRRFPAGLVSAIAPFNFPLNLVAHKVAPALMTGCPVIVKPGDQTPMAALELAKICEAAGVPAGGVQVVPCGREVADALVTDERPKVLSFTGSAKVGWDMKARCGRKKVVLELGGDAAVILGHDADLDAALPRTAFGAYVYAGQVCISVQRILVHEAIYGLVKDRLVKEIEKLGVGDPRDEDNVVGPMIDEKNAARMAEWIDEAVRQGAKLLCGGERRDRNVVTPALLENVPADARLAREEAFGPIAYLERFSSMDEAVERVNASRYGLQVGVYTDSIADVWRCFDGCVVGGVLHNDVPTFRVDHMPYGGVKASGFGREGLKYAVDDYTERRLLALRPSP